MKIVLFGKNGQLGHSLQMTLSPMASVVAFDRHQANFEDPETLRDIIRREEPTVIINAAAYTQVDKAEDETERAFAINASAPGILAEEAQKSGAWLVHYSTDYVYDGEKAAPYTEEDTPNPLSFYGQSKLAGDNAIIRSHDKYMIMRTSWCYSLYGKNFPKTILELARHKDHLTVVSDQIGAPTSTQVVSDVTLKMINHVAAEPPATQFSGLYHVAAGGAVSWYDYARFVVRAAAQFDFPLVLNANAIQPILAKDYGQKAQRPPNSRLDTQKIATTFGIQLPEWQEDVLSFVEQYCKNAQGVKRI